MGTTITSSVTRAQGLVRRVLVVEDIPSTRERLVTVLTSRGFTPVTACNGKDAMDLLARTPGVEAILLDLIMADGNGFEFRACQLRDPRLAAIPTIVLTAKRLADYECYALRVVPRHVIQKPFDDHQVLEALARIHDESSSTQWVRTRVPWRENGRALFWSRGGQVACEQHAPPAASPQWSEEGWTAISAANRRRTPEYRCQFCDGGPIRHPLTVRRSRRA